MKVSKDLLLKMPCHPDGDDCILGGGVDPKYSISPTNTFPGNRRSEKFLFDRKKKEKNTPNSCGEKIICAKFTLKLVHLLQGSSEFPIKNHRRGGGVPGEP